MSVSRFPAKGFLLSACISLALAGCATNKIDITPVVEFIPEPVKGHQVSNCEATQRDLTVPWSLRQYWCGNERRKGVLQYINDGVMKQVVSSNLVFDQVYLNDINVEVDKTHLNAPIVDSVKQTPEILPPSLNRKEAIKRLKDNGKSKNIKTSTALTLASTDNSNTKNIHTASNLKIDSDSENSIIFARNIRVLGPQGRAATHALIDQVTGSGQVLIRGLILPDEILVDSTLYREQVSVGRALAVRKYWEDQGLDISHIKILHHNPELAGRSVEVVFCG